MERTIVHCFHGGDGLVTEVVLASTSTAWKGGAETERGREGGRFYTWPATPEREREKERGVVYTSTLTRCREECML